MTLFKRELRSPVATVLLKTHYGDHAYAPVKGRHHRGAAFTMDIESYHPAHGEAVAGLSLRAWAPVFESLEQVMDPAVFREFFPDWRVSQQKAVEDACASKEMRVWVAVDGEAVAGFVAVKFDAESKLGEIYMVAVDPDHQRRGIGGALSRFALDRMKEAGMTVAMVETGGDPGHAPARGAYEKLGFRLFPVARYFMKL